MVSKTIRRVMWWGAVSLALAICFFLDPLGRLGIGAPGRIAQELLGIFRDQNTQWMVLLCVGVYLAVLMALQWRRQRSVFGFNHPDLYLAGGMFLALRAYGFSYSTASGSLQALALLGGAAIGKGFFLLAGFGAKGSQRNDSLAPCLVILTLMLAFASIWHPAAGTAFNYREQARWSGPWDNPNLFGLLMGTGTILAAGLAVVWNSFPESSDAADVRRKTGAGTRVIVLLFFVAAILSGYGLLNSYSRGAWVATTCGAIYLAVQWFRLHGSSARSRMVVWLRKNWLSLGLIAFSVAVLLHQEFQHTNWLPARRAFSATNPNDFSWRNRVAAWEGALEIMAEHPWLGAGWNRPDSLYEPFYLPPRLTESGAIEMNDYLFLGATLGIPALACFLGHILLRLIQADRRCPAADGSFRVHPGSPLQCICRAGAMVPAVGFWFDGGLFHLPTAATFWILLELGRPQLK